MKVRISIRAVAGAFVFAGLLFWMSNRLVVRPAETDTFFKMGQIASGQGSPAVSIRRIREAIELTPREDQYYVILARDWVELARSDSAGRSLSYFREAESALEKARELNPMRLDHTMNLARLYDQEAAFSTDPKMQERLQARALSLMETAADRAPGMPGIELELGSMSVRADSEEAAIRHYRKAISLDSTWAEPYVRIANLYLAGDSLTAAFDLLSGALTATGSNWQVLAALGYVELRRGRLDEASEYLTAAASGRPGEPALYRNLVLVESRLSRCDSAERWMSEMKDLGLLREAADLEKTVAARCR